MNNKHLYPLLTACVLLTQTAAADTPLEELVVTSSRIEMPLRQVGTSVSVLTADDIQALGFPSLVDALRTQPAIGVTNTGGPGKVSTLRIRGEEGFRTRVLLDGIDITDPSSPQPSPRMEQLLSSGVSRVEILRGPQGMLYGADAGGVVNITSHPADKGFNGQLRGESGRYGTRQLSADLGLGGDTLGGVLSVADYETDGFNARSDDTDPGDDDGYQNTTAHARLDWTPIEKLGFTLVGRDVEGETEYDNCYTASFMPSNDCSDDYRLRAWRGAAAWRGESLRHELAYSASETKRAINSEGVKNYEYQGEIGKLSYLGSFTAADALRLVYGVDLKTESLRQDGGSESRDEDGYFLEYQGSWSDRLHVTAGVRYDDNEDFGSYDSWRVSGAYLVPVTGGEFKLRSAWGTGFRAPSLYEIAYNKGPWAFPPAQGTDLDAEESEGYDLAIAWYGDNGLYLEAVYFDQLIDREIVFDLAGYSGYLQDVGEAKSSGIELIAEWVLPAGFTASGNFTYNDTETSSGTPRFYRPKHLANLGLDWRALEDRLHLGLSARLSRDAVDTSGTDVDDYEVLNLYASFALLPGLDVYGRVENLLDEDYQEAPPFNTSGSAAYAGVRYSF